MAQIGIPGGPEATVKVLGAWGGLNTHADRAALPENDFSWLENLFPIAPGNLRTLYAEGSNVYTTSNPRTIINMFPYNLGATAYVALFLDDGSALQIRVSDGASTTIGAAATFYSGGTIPACSQYQSKYLIIGSDVAANAYWVWDGTSLYGAGTLSPQVTIVSGGRNYTSAPTLTAMGGSGTGATFATTVANGVVTDAKATAGGSGYLLGEKVTLSFSGGGSDTEAQATAVVTQAGAIVGAVNITSGGSGYASPATVTISAPTTSNTQAVATANVSGGVITSVTINTAGSGYFGSPTLSFSGGGGTGATATVTINSSAAIASINITNGGSGYAGPTFAVTIGAPEAVITAKAVSTVTNGIVTAVTITDPGFGYIAQPTVTFSAGTTTATGSVQLIKGQVDRIDVTNGGSGYIGVPTITLSAPDDPTALIPTTATAAATISGGAITSITVSNRGAGYLRASVDIRGGNNAAHAIATLMPFGIQATAIETYNNQVWTTANPTAGPKMSFTAPNSVSDFGTFSGGGSAPATDSFLRRALVGLKQDNGFLYRFADSSVNVITNVQTSATGVTTYNNANVDSQSGTIWRDTICAFDRAIVFASSTGVYALFGGAVQKVSDQLDGLFLSASFNTGVSGVTPTASVVTLFGVRCYVLLFTTTDLYSGTKRNIMCIWNGQRWFAATQTKTLTLIALQEIDSVFTAWGTDGTHLFKLFQTPSTSLTKVFQTRYDGANIPDTVFRVDNVYLIVNLTNGASGTISMSMDTETGSAPSQTYSMATGGRQILLKDVTPSGAYYGVLRGFTATTTAADLQFISIERLESEQTRIT